MKIDLAIYNRFHKLVLAVETKRKFGATKNWAVKTRHNLFAHGFYPLGSYFLLATPEKFFLWTPENNTAEETMPNFVEEAEKYLEPQLKKLSFDIRKIDEYLFQEVVRHWLTYDLVHPTQNSLQPKWLKESGLGEEILHGNLITEAVI